MGFRLGRACAERIEKGLRWKVEERETERYGLKEKGKKTTFA
jgi:hypothetical protein